MIWYYGIFFLLSVSNIVIFLLTKKKYTSSLYLCLFLLMAISSYGYLMCAFSTTADGAAIATQIEYLGGQFIPMIMLLLVSKFINFKYHNILSIVLFLFAMVYFGLVMTIGHSNIYYESFTYVTIRGVGGLEKVYGKAYIFSKIYPIVYICLFIGFLIYAYMQLTTVSYKNLTYLTILIVVTMTVSMVSKKIIDGVDLIPFAYWTGGVLTILFLRRAHIYNMDYAVSVNMENRETYGYVGFSINQVYIGNNAKAQELFPELKDLKIDNKLPDNEFCNKIKELFNSVEDESIPNYFNIERNGRIYKIELFKNKTRKKADFGYFLEIYDDTDNLKMINLLDNYNKTLEGEVKLKTEEIVEIQNKIVLGMADLVETRDESTGGHVKRTSDIVKIITNSIKELGVYNLTDEFLEYVRRAAPMHDLGKLNISDHILNKPGRFTDEEYAIMKTHSFIGSKYVSAILDGVEEEAFVEVAKNVARYHHEKYNGGGYPDNLVGEDIPVEARIMALADVYDALVSKRVYKESMSFEKANEIILESMGSHFDPKLAPVFENARPKLEAYYSNAN